MMSLAGRSLGTDLRKLREQCASEESAVHQAADRLREPACAMWLYGTMSPLRAQRARLNHERPRRRPDSLSSLHHSHVFRDSGARRRERARHSGASLDLAAAAALVARERATDAGAARGDREIIKVGSRLLWSGRDHTA